jgi:hypothetical protein
MVHCKFCDFECKEGDVMTNIAVVIAHTLQKHPESKIKEKLDEVN